MDLIDQNDNDDDKYLAEYDISSRQNWLEEEGIKEADHQLKMK